MTTVRLGNTAPVEVRRENEEDLEGTRTALDIPDGGSVTEIRFPDDLSLSEALIAITTPARGTWDAHSDDPPEWVSSDNQQFAELLAANYSVGGHTCEVRPFEDDTPVGMTAGATAAIDVDAASSEKPRTSRRRAAARDDESE